jgi:hypothetical protein
LAFFFRDRSSRFSRAENPAPAWPGVKMAKGAILMADKWIVYKILTPAGTLRAVNYCSEADWHETVEKANMVMIQKFSEHATEKDAYEIASLTGLLPDTTN